METPLFSAFLGARRVACGTLAEVQAAALALTDHSHGTLLVFSHATGQQTDLAASGGTPSPPKPGPGRPRLGVVSTEVTLLPRHWEWLNAQPARASGTLRRLVEAAMAGEASDPKRRLEALGKILWAVAGNLPNFEEASRALYAGDRARLNDLAAAWPEDLPAFVRDWQ
jgi:hypothetical protein